MNGILGRVGAFKTKPMMQQQQQQQQQQQLQAAAAAAQRVGGAPEGRHDFWPRVPL
jgi:membrane protease subunit (stomatin/prohibitin family)